MADEGLSIQLFTTLQGLSFVIYENTNLLRFALPDEGSIYPSRGRLYLFRSERLDGGAGPNSIPSVTEF